ncbi:MAG: extracellular solute-binding protein [Burkholderiales bacterium]|nr:extracellular solute-binding protein [Burkholderiales bacterium]
MTNFKCLLRPCGPLCRRALLAVALVAGPLLAHAQRVNLRVVDVGGALNLLQKGIESYVATHPGVTVTFSNALAPELPARLASAMAESRAEADLVLGGNDILAAGLEMGLWTRILPDHAAKFPGLLDNYFKEARKMQDLANSQAVAVVYMLGGPLLEFNPDAVKTPPATPEELLAWCRAHPGRFSYARPANSGPGRSFLMGLPYLLGDSDPKDPVNGWSRTWAFLKALNTCIDGYPARTGTLMKELGEKHRDIIVTTTGWDIYPRATGVVPRSYKVSAFKNMTWVNDAQYMMVPRNLPPARLAVVLDLMAHLLKREQQALTYDSGYFYPGPAVKNVPFSLAPQASQDVIRQFGRVEYVLWGLNSQHVQPLSPQLLVKAFRIWEEEIGATRK